MFKFWVLLLIFKNHFCAALLHPPNYLRACKLSDPNVNQCAMESANIAIPHLAKGDPTYGIPALNPFFLEHLAINVTENLHIEFFNASVYGLHGTKVIDASLSGPHKQLNMSATLPQLAIIGQYKIDGSLMVMKMQGQGFANLTLIDVRINYGCNWVAQKKRNTTVARITQYSIDIRYKKGYCSFDNLFNGNQLLGDNINRFLNDNDEEVAQEIKPALEQTVGPIIYTIVNKFFGKIPYNELLL